MAENDTHSDFREITPGAEHDTAEHRLHKQQMALSMKALIDFKAALDEHAIVAITDPHGKIIYVNDKFCTISKYSSEELIGQDHRIVNSGHHPKTFIRDLWRTISTGKVWKGEIKNRAKDGTFYWVDTTIVPFLGDTGKPVQFIAIRTDITERKRLEQELKESNIIELEKALKVAKDSNDMNQILNMALHQKVLARETEHEELESYSHSVSHDLRSPLRFVNRVAHKLLDENWTELPEKAVVQVNMIVQATEEMGLLIDRLLIFSQSSRVAMKIRKVDLHRLFQKIAKELKNGEEGRDVEIEIQEMEPCQSDQTLLKEVVSNLLENAFKYTQRSERAKITIGCMEKDGEHVYFVKDNGVGFDMKDSDLLYVPFKRLHKEEDFKGTGIGLALVKRIIERHGGRIWAEGEIGKGATFYFTLEKATAE